jgi:hypothetical protein
MVEHGVAVLKELRMRDDVLQDELRARFGSSDEMLRAWFHSLRPADRLHVIELLDAQIGSLPSQPGEGIGRRDRLESIRTLFTQWINAETA